MENQKQNQESLQLDVLPDCRKEKTGTRTIPPPGVHEGFSSSSSSRRGILASSQTISAAEKLKMGQNLLKLFHEIPCKMLAQRQGARGQDFARQGQEAKSLHVAPSPQVQP